MIGGLYYPLNMYGNEEKSSDDINRNTDNTVQKYRK